MYNNYDYPYGADGPNAPWNDVEVPEKDFDVVCSQSLSKTVTVTTNDYIPGASGVDYESDGEGGYVAEGWHDPDDTSDTNWKEAYESCAMTPMNIIEACKTLSKFLLTCGTTTVDGLNLKKLEAECESWTIDEYDIEEA